LIVSTILDSFNYHDVLTKRINFKRWNYKKLETQQKNRNNDTTIKL